jgi:hypothetical protein
MATDLTYRFVEDQPAYKFVDEPKTEEKSVAEDVAKSAAVAPLKGAANIVGLPSTVMELLAAGARKVGGAMGLDTRFAYPTFPNLGTLAREGFANLGLGYQPQTTQGKYAGAAVEGAFSAPTNPSMMLTGAGSGVGAETGARVGANYGPTGEVVGSLLGSLAGGIATGKAIQPIQNTLTSEQKAVVARAKEMGMKLTPGQQTGSRRMQAFENTTEAMPGGGFLAQQRADNLKIANEKSLGTIGETGSDLSPTTIGNAVDRIGGEFDRLTKGRNIKLDQRFFDDVRAIVKEQGKLAEPNQSVMTTLQKWLQPSGAKNVSIGSDVYQANRSVYATDARQGFRLEGGAQEARAKQALVRALDDAAERSLPMKDLADFKKARKEWANLEILERSDPSKSGYNINPNNVANALKAQNPKVGRIPLGERDMVDISRMGSLLRDATPNSGTPERALWTYLLSGGLGAGIGGAAGGPMGAAGGVAASLAIPSIAQRAIMAPGINQYLSGGLMPGFQQTPALAEYVRALELAQNPRR